MVCAPWLLGKLWGVGNWLSAPQCLSLQEGHSFVEKNRNKIIPSSPLGTQTPANTPPWLAVLSSIQFS